MKERQRWQPEEDALLKAYVKQYGPKEWNLVSQRMSKPLDRDAKSCLERWKNYLKPGIKKGSLTQEEQSLVISLQAKYGNKWKKIASEVPGRTAKRLGKWWEVFKEKQLKQSLQSKRHSHFSPSPSSTPVSTPTPPPLSSSSTTPSITTTTPDQSSTVHSQYDHILETFAEKYVQPKLKMLIPTNLAPAPPTLCLGSSNKPTIGIDPSPISMPPPTSLPAWLSSASSSATNSTSCCSSPSVNLSLSPTEPGPEPNTAAAQHLHHRQHMNFLPVQQMVQFCKELEEVRMSWVQQKKEATWRLSRLEQQLESEKARKRREKMEEVEANIRALREEERAYMERIETDCREQLSSIQRDAEAKEAKMVDAWASKHVRLAKLVEQLGLQQQHLHFNVGKELH
ncbi:protein rough sheath 2 homolog [Magnolia sinica]|uniref:protein rough sheath 2 homolog n=1 Tax=Magnolia sinica TaxID=86752 RepID=UPI0026597CFD|nr:protein rough sheath 2 homolog [Magnolia sinica]